MKIGTVIFDLDGTLIDSAPSIIKALKAVLEDSGIETQVALTPSIIGPPLLQTLSHITGISPNDSSIHQLAAQFKERYDQEFCIEASAFEGIEILLDALSKKSRMKIMLATNKRHRPCKRILDHLSWNYFFKSIYCIDSHRAQLESKEDILRHLSQSESIVPARTLYVGDRTTDRIAAEALAFDFAQAGWGYSEIDLRENRQGDGITVFSNPTDLLNFIYQTRRT